MFKTRVTELLGIDYPIIMGGMTRVGDARLVAAVSNAGGLGILPVGGRELNFVREEIRQVRRLTDRPFGVNIPLIPGVTPVKLEDLINAFIEERVPVVETAGRNPGNYVKLLKDGGIKVIHKCTSVRFARTAEKEGVDAVAILGFEGGGHIGAEEVAHMVLIPRTVDNIRVPVIAAGGIADGRGLVAALALGADAILMGTRFLATEEAAVHPKVKEWLVQATENDTVIVGKVTGWPDRVAKNKLTLQILDMEKRGVELDRVLELRSGARTEKEVWRGGYIDGGTATVGQVVGLLTSIPTVDEVIQNIMSEALTIIQRLKVLAE